MTLYTPDEDVAMATFEGFAAAGQDAADSLGAAVTVRVR
jgi:hypothetical protein